jgi:hypothetical protein
MPPPDCEHNCDDSWREQVARHVDRAASHMQRVLLLQRARSK